MNNIDGNNNYKDQFFKFIESKVEAFIKKANNQNVALNFIQQCLQWATSHHLPCPIKEENKKLITNKVSSIKNKEKSEDVELDWIELKEIHSIFNSKLGDVFETEEQRQNFKENAQVIVAQRINQLGKRKLREAAEKAFEETPQTTSHSRELLPRGANAASSKKRVIKNKVRKIDSQQAPILKKHPLKEKSCENDLLPPAALSKKRKISTLPTSRKKIGKENSEEAKDLIEKGKMKPIFLENLGEKETLLLKKFLQKDLLPIFETKKELRTFLAMMKNPSKHNLCLEGYVTITQMLTMTPQLAGNLVKLNEQQLLEDKEGVKSLTDEHLQMLAHPAIFMLIQQQKISISFLKKQAGESFNSFANLAESNKEINDKLSFVSPETLQKFFNPAFSELLIHCDCFFHWILKWEITEVENLVLLAQSQLVTYQAFSCFEQKNLRFLVHPQVCPHVLTGRVSFTQVIALSEQKRGKFVENLKNPHFNQLFAEGRLSWSLVNRLTQREVEILSDVHASQCVSKRILTVAQVFQLSDDERAKCKNLVHEAALIVMENHLATLQRILALTEQEFLHLTLMVEKGRTIPPQLFHSRVSSVHLEICAKTDIGLMIENGIITWEDFTHFSPEELAELLTKFDVSTGDAKAFDLTDHILDKIISLDRVFKVPQKQYQAVINFINYGYFRRPDVFAKCNTCFFTFIRVAADNTATDDVLTVLKLHAIEQKILKEEIKFSDVIVLSRVYLKKLIKFDLLLNLCPTLNLNVFYTAPEETLNCLLTHLTHA